MSGIDPLEEQLMFAKRGCLLGCCALPLAFLFIAINANDMGGPLIWPIAVVVGGFLGAIIGFVVTRIKIIIEKNRT